MWARIKWSHLHHLATRARCRGGCHPCRSGTPAHPNHPGHPGHPGRTAHSSLPRIDHSPRSVAVAPIRLPRCRRRRSCRRKLHRHFPGSAPTFHQLMASFPLILHPGAFHLAPARLDTLTTMTRPPRPSRPPLCGILAPAAAIA